MTLSGNAHWTATAACASTPWWRGVSGMGFVIIRQAVLDGCAGNNQRLAMDLNAVAKALRERDISTPAAV